MFWNYVFKDLTYMTCTIQKEIYDLTYMVCTFYRVHSGQKGRLFGPDLYGVYFVHITLSPDFMVCIFVPDLYGVYIPDVDLWPYLDGDDFE